MRNIHQELWEMQRKIDILDRDASLAIKLLRLLGSRYGYDISIDDFRKACCALNLRLEPGSRVRGVNGRWEVL